MLLGDFLGLRDTSSSPDDQQLVRDGVHALVPIIVSKSSDRNTRSIEGTKSTLVFLARQPLVGCSAVMSSILTTISNAKEVAAIRGRLELISQFITDFGFSKSSGMSLSAVMGFVRPHLDAADEKMRRYAVEVTVQCYQVKGERTRKFCANLKPALQRLLEQRFAEVDGSTSSKPSKAPGVLPELRGTRGASRGLPKLTIKSRGNATGSAANPLDRPKSNLSMMSRSTTSSEEAQPSIKRETSIQQTVQTLVTQDEENNDDEIYSIEQFAAEMDDPNFIPSPTAMDDVFGKES